MKIGVPKEIKIHEYRVGMVPSGVVELTQAGHQVVVQSGAGVGIGFADSDYTAAGASIAGSAQEVFDQADMVVKVKEPQPEECAMLKEGQVLFTFLHLAPDPVQTKGLVDSGCIAIAYETVTDSSGRLPLLVPMSEIAGRMSIQAGAHCMEKANGGRGILLSGSAGVLPAKVVVLGGGVVGINAARIALGMGAEVSVLDRSLPRLMDIDITYNGQMKTLFSNSANVLASVEQADLVVGSVLIPGAAAPKIVTRDMLTKMKPHSVIVDVAIDQGGCFETSRPTNHQEPTYVEEDIIHYCVANMPGGVALTSTLALTNATLPYVLTLANNGWQQALTDNIGLRNGLNIHAGQVTYEAVSSVLDYEYVSPDSILGIG